MLRLNTAVYPISFQYSTSLCNVCTAHGALFYKIFQCFLPNLFCTSSYTLLELSSSDCNFFGFPKLEAVHSHALTQTHSRRRWFENVTGGDRTLYMRAESSSSRSEKRVIVSEVYTEEIRYTSRTGLVRCFPRIIQNYILMVQKFCFNFWHGCSTV